MAGIFPDKSNTDQSDLLASNTRSGIRGTFLSQTIRMIFSLASLPIIARQLTPQDYGLFALLLLFVMFLDSVREFGITTAVMGAEKFDKKTRSNLFWISSLSGIAILGAGFITSDLFLTFLKLEEYHLELKCLLLLLFFNGISNIYVLNLRRTLDFNRVIAIEVISSSVSITAALISALSGLGIWALIIQVLTVSLFTFILSLIFSDWKPISPSKSSEVKTLYTNGFFFFIEQYLVLFSAQFPTFMLGKSEKVIDAGNFDRGRQIQNILHYFFNFPIRQIGVPILRARYHLEGTLDRSTQKVHRLTLHIQLPIYVLIFCQAELIVQILYGDKYTAVIPIFRILMIAAMIQTSSYIRMWVVIILNQGRNSLKHAIFSFLVYAFCILAFVSRGVLYVSCGYLIATFVTMIFGFLFIKKIQEVNILKLLAISLKFLFVYISLAIVLFLLEESVLDSFGSFYSFLFELLTVVFVTVAHLKYSNFLVEYGSFIRSLIHRK
jgi:PST family polysaccharide transporter